MSDSPVLITGRKDTGKAYPRLSIDDLQKDHQQFLLFILSYSALQQRTPNAKFMPSNEQSSSPVFSAIKGAYSKAYADPPKSAAMLFSEIAGIHGLPYQPWKGDPNHDSKADYDENDPKDMRPMPTRFGGYCNHGSVLFPSWHRPYVMAIEQAIGEVADRIAQQLDQSGVFKETWAESAKALRFPWWDWAAEGVGKTGLPTVFSDKEVVLKVTKDITVAVENPIAYFPFMDIPKGFKDVTDPDTKMTAYFSKWKRTVRYAKSNPDDPESDTDALNEALKKEAASVRRRVASLFTLSAEKEPQTAASRTYDEFSNHTVQSTNQLHYYTADSLEGVHDSMHDILGGNGHMGYPDYAGFDPIFYFHHCNVDRLYALWEYVYPKECYIGDWELTVPGKKPKDYPFTQSSGTYALAYNQQLLGDTILAPFRRNDGEYWTSDNSRYFNKDAYPKYYTYPAVAGVDVTKPLPDEERAKKYRKLLQDYYGVEQSFSTVPAELTSFVNPSGVEGVKKTKPPSITRIVIGVQTPEFAFNGPYSIAVNYQKDGIQQLYVGSISIFARQPESDCGSCKSKRQIGTTVHGILPLSKEILDDLVDVIGKGVDPAAPDNLIKELKGRLSATIFDRHKKPVGSAKGSEDELTWGSFAALEPHLTPTITVASSFVKLEGEDQTKKGPVYWDGWTNHGDVFHPNPDVTKWRVF
ncbi:hypothetical protein V5O48_014930 [Marasmius crinis-equi]|uniref:tyrosinase n=1 Tax=Marasmius crinis-equi TaxID=585013 RepID=A0ABR3EVX9_9AGAR